MHENIFTKVWLLLSERDAEMEPAHIFFLQKWRKITEQKKCLEIYSCRHVRRLWAEVNEGGCRFGTEEPKENIPNPSMLLHLSHRLKLHWNKQVGRLVNFSKCALVFEEFDGFLFWEKHKVSGFTPAVACWVSFQAGVWGGICKCSRPDCGPLRAAAAGSSSRGRLLTEGSERSQRLLL